MGEVRGKWFGCGVAVERRWLRNDKERVRVKNSPLGRFMGRGGGMMKSKNSRLKTIRNPFPGYVWGSLYYYRIPQCDILLRYCVSTSKDFNQETMFVRPERSF